MIPILLLVIKLSHSIYVEESRPGVCPPFRTGGICNQALIKSNCTGKDSDCTEQGQKCCPGLCGSFSCQNPITGDRPGCRVIDSNLQCIAFRQECNSDIVCGSGKQCCFHPSCGTTCQAILNPPPNSMCPPYRHDVICKRFERQCSTNDDCHSGDICCTVECGTKCKSPYGPPDVCFLPKDPGHCNGHFPRYYYHHDSRTCYLFIYGGCGGHDNNFQTLEECEETCKKPDPPCKPVFCDLSCTLGFARDENRCEVCKCNETPKCPPVCEIFCPFGYVLDSNSCPTCQCKTGCANEAPAHPTATCDSVSKSCPPTYTCSISQLLDHPGVCCPRGNSCPPDPVCPRPPRGEPGTCPPKCVYRYEEINGVRCKVECIIGEKSPKEDPCPSIDCPWEGIREPPGPLSVNPCPPDPVCPRPPKGEKGDMGICPPKCVYRYEEINGVRCKVECMIGEKGRKEFPCPLTNCPWDREPRGDPCPPNPVCPRPPKGEKGDVGTCPPKCVYRYEEIDGVRCQVACVLEKGQKGPPCPSTDCPWEGIREPPGPLSDTKCPPLCDIFCPFGNVLDNNDCPICKCNAGPCKLPPCAPPPPGACTEPDYRIIDGVRCPWCSKIIPCKEKQCPDVSVDSACYDYSRECMDDSSCTDGKKCCRKECSYICKMSTGACIHQ